MADSEIIFSVHESREGGYEARSLGYSIFTQADTMEALRHMCADAVYCHFGYALPYRIVRASSVAEAAQ